MTENTQPVAPYLAVGLSTVVHGVGERKHIERNLAIVEDGIHAAMSVIGINMPVRVIALAEGALTGFTDEAFDVPHVTAARDLFIDVPGEETERLSALARHYDVYLMVQCKARWPEVIEDRYFNMLFVISPRARSCTAPPRTTSGAASAPARRTTSTTAGWSSSATGSTPSTRCCAPTTSATSGRSAARTASTRRPCARWP